MALPVPPPPSAINQAPSAATPPPPVNASPAPSATPPPMPSSAPPAAVQQAAPAPQPAAAPVAQAPAPQPVAPAAPPVAEVPATPPAPVAPQAPQAQQMAAAPTGTTAMANTAPAGTGLAAQAEAAGFGGLDFGFGACPIISLKNTGKFKTTDDEDLGTEFLFRMNGSRPKYLFATKVEQTDERNEAVYSYDGVTNANNDRPIQEYVDKWAAAGIATEKKTYLEVEAVMQDNTMALLSIPSSGVRRLSKAVGNLAGRGVPFAEIPNHWLKAFAGKEVTNVKVPFIPWDFAIYEG